MVKLVGTYVLLNVLLLLHLLRFDNKNDSIEKNTILQDVNWKIKKPLVWHFLQRIILLGTLDPFNITLTLQNHKKLTPPLNNKHGQKKWKCLELDSSRLYGRRNHFAR